MLTSIFSSVSQLCPTLCHPMNRSTPGLPVHYQLPEFTQTHIHRVSDAIQPSHPLSSPSPPAPSASQMSILAKEITSIEFRRNYSNQLVQRRNESFQQRKLNHSHVAVGESDVSKMAVREFPGSRELKGNDEDAQQGRIIEQQKFCESTDGLI